MSQSASSKKTTMTLLTLRGSSESASHSLVMAGLPLASCSIRQDITASPSCLRRNILSNWSLDRDCLLCVTGCKHDVLAGILQNRISLNDQLNILSFFRLVKRLSDERKNNFLSLPTFQSEAIWAASSSLLSASSHCLPNVSYNKTNNENWTDNKIEIKLKK